MDAQTNAQQECLLQLRPLSLGIRLPSGIYIVKIWDQKKSLLPVFPHMPSRKRHESRLDPGTR